MEENNNSVVYEENWQQVSEPEYCVINDTGDEEDTHEQQSVRKRANHPLLLTIRLIICLLIAAAAFVIKSIGGDFYDNALKLYHSQLAQSAVYDGKRQYDLSYLFTKATADER